ncbi:hypothetical protein ACIBO1_00535 [Micromonospora sp. NPDC049903]|uniref:hypothetical protein n=1 Tax=Micromonospora sp. NPDC049903 TaxID=3364276 RepID=UPI00378F3EFE
MIVAAVELLAATQLSGEERECSAEWVLHIRRLLGEGLDLRRTPGRDWLAAMLTYPGPITDWIEALHNGFRHLLRARQAIGPVLDPLLDEVWLTACDAGRGGESHANFGGVTALAREDPARYIGRYLDFGVFSTFALAYASAAALARTADAEALADRAFDLWKLADEKVKVARRSPFYADVLAAAYECCFRYTEAKVLLRWSIARQEESGTPVEDELRREVQIVEELRAAMADASRANYFARMPSILSSLRLYMDATADPRQVVTAAIEQASVANPLFPQRVVELWHREAAAVPPSREMPKLVARRVEAALPAAFDDPLTVRTGLAIQHRQQ